MKNKLLLSGGVALFVLLLTTTMALALSYPTLVSYWPADNSALDAVDGNDGTLGAGVVYDTGKYGQAFSFAGTTTSYVQIPFNSNLNPTNWTMAAWVKPTAPSNGQTWIFGQDFSKQLNAIPGSDSTHIRIQWQIYAGGFWAIYSTTQLPVGEWTHVAGTWDGSYLRLYINGVLESQSLVSYPPGVNSCPFFIGGVFDSTCGYSGQFFTGDVDEAKFFSSALSAGEIAGLINQAPTADAGGPYLAAVNTSIQLDGSGSSDPNGDTLTYSWDFGDSSSGSGVMPAHSYAAPGIYDVCLTVNDGTVDSEASCTIAVVYDPDGGFVTGGGWLDSPAGAYIPDASLSGKASFGFVSKYKKGATVPTGNTEFQFQAGDFNFHSEAYDWLVVNQSGTNAQFKGSGTVNGALDPNGNAYKFMLWAGDGSPDTFRIQIWWEDGSGEHVVYDNGVNQPIGGGSIVVHD